MTSLDTETVLEPTIINIIIMRSAKCKLTAGLCVRLVVNHFLESNLSVRACSLCTLECDHTGCSVEQFSPCSLQYRLDTLSGTN